MGRSQVKHAHTKPRGKGDTLPRILGGVPCFVYATGPGLTEEVLQRTHAETGWAHVAISDYYRTGYPCDFFYACDHKWWNVHYDKVKQWEKDTQHGGGLWCTELRTKRQYPGLNWIEGKGDNKWSTDPSMIHYGGNSGFQILNIAFLLGSPYMVLCGFNMSKPGGKAHFFGDHPEGLGRTGGYQNFAARFNAIRPEQYGVTVINATPQTKLRAFQRKELEDAISGFRN